MNPSSYGEARPSAVRGGNDTARSYVHELRGLVRSYARARALSQDLLSAVTVAAVALPLNSDSPSRAVCPPRPA